MREVFFSVVIPTLNEEDYLPRLLKDLYSQKERSFEVIVVDGQSTDNTVSLAKKFQSKLQLRVLESRKKSVSFQRNLGATHARGKYLIFFDADVQIPPRFLSDLRKDIVHHRAQLLTTYIHSDSREVADELIAKFYNAIIEIAVIIERPFIPGFNFVVKKKVFDDVGGFRNDIIHGEDYDLALRIFEAKKYKLTILKDPKLVFSLRRFRKEGRLSVVRKNVKATFHILTKGPITKAIFSYPMGGGWYKFAKKDTSQNGFEKAEAYMKKFVRLFLE